MNYAVSLEKVHIEKIGTRSGPSIIFKGIGLCSVHITQHGKEQGQKPSCQRNGCGNWAWQLGFFVKKRKTSNPCEAFFSSLSSVRRAVDLGRRVWPVSLSTRWACREKNCGQTVDGFRIQNVTFRQFTCLKLKLFLLSLFVSPGRRRRVACRTAGEPATTRRKVFLC